MNLHEYFREMLALEARATAKTIDSLDSVPPERRKSPEFQRALGVMAHMQLARHIWLERLRGRELKPIDWFPPQDAAASREQATRLDVLWGEFVGSLGEGGLEQECLYTSSEGVGYSSKVREIIAHVLNHSTYHRGQIARLVSECGGMRAQTDLIVFTRRTLGAAR